MNRRSGLGADAGMAQIADQFAASGGAGLAGAGVEVDLGLTVAIGRLADEMQRRREYEQAMAQAVHPFELAAGSITVTAGAGTNHDAAKYGPRDGYAWDIRNLVAASFSAGTVAVYKNSAGQAVDANLRFTFTSAGLWQMGTAQLLLLPGQYLTFVAAGITGNVTLSGDGIQVALPFLAAYLM
jgi:hypothetical protein